MRGLLAEMGGDVSRPTVLHVDNRGAIELAKDRRSCQRSRHIARRSLKLREYVADGHIEVKYIDTRNNAADMLTKPLPREDFERHLAALAGAI